LHQGGVALIKKTVIVLGANGMLGSMLVDYFSKQENINLVATARALAFIKRNKVAYPNVTWRVVDAESGDLCGLGAEFFRAEYIINAIGLIKHIIDEKRPEHVIRAIKVNSVFPYILARSMYESKILQIETDCVYSGKEGNYKETALHEPMDVYGKTKSLGEVRMPNMHHLRCSIIGFDTAHRSLLSWFLNQPNNAKINGYENHFWNGVTTLHFAKICNGIIQNDIQMPHLQHIVPEFSVSKDDLLGFCGKWFNRHDIEITRMQAADAIDRTLDTHDKSFNLKLWHAAGYDKSPEISNMVKELAYYKEGM
jgi:dTDP-4-dehydrorhamnose reductase